MSRPGREDKKIVRGDILNEQRDWAESLKGVPTENLIEILTPFADRMVEPSPGQLNAIRSVLDRYPFIASIAGEDAIYSHKVETPLIRLELDLEKESSANAQHRISLSLFAWTADSASEIRLIDAGIKLFDDGSSEICPAKSYLYLCFRGLVEGRGYELRVDQ